jgi:uncharacterized protein
MIKKTLVIGASMNPERYSFMAIHKLVTHKHETVALGNKDGMVAGLKILKGFPEINNIHTVALYINPEKQKMYINYILELQPKRIIFNPGTENPHFEKLAKKLNISTTRGCVLVLLSTNRY